MDLDRLRLSSQAQREDDADRLGCEPHVSREPGDQPAGSERDGNLSDHCQDSDQQIVG